MDNPNKNRNIAIGAGIGFLVLCGIFYFATRSSSNSSTSSGASTTQNTNSQNTNSTGGTQNVSTPTVSPSTPTVSPSTPTPVDCEVLKGNWICDPVSGLATRSQIITTQPSNGGQPCPKPETQICKDCEFTQDNWKCDNSTKTATKKVNVITPAFYGGQECPQSQTQHCNDCEFTWGNWQTNTVTGMATRKPNIITQASGGGQACPVQDTQPYNDCEYTLGNWTCDKNTGIATQNLTITKQPTNGGKACPAPNTKECDRDCQFTWGTWSECDRTTGLRKRTATITAPPKLNGALCPTQPETSQCDRDCVVSWSDWKCDTTTGLQSRQSTVTTTQVGNGAPCPVSPDVKTCNVDCVVQYNNWGECNPTTGTKTRTGTVVTDKKNQGAPCGPLTQSTACDVDCLVNSQAFTTCNYSDMKQTQYKTVTRQPKNQGATCGNLVASTGCTITGPYIYVKQLFITTIQAPVKYNIGAKPMAPFSQSGVVPGWTTTATTYGGLCVFDINFTAWSGSQTGNELGVFAFLIDGIAQLPLITCYFNNPGDHTSVPASSVVTYLSPGIHTFALAINYRQSTSIAVDVYDRLVVRLTEYSRSLVDGTNPSVYISQPFNQTKALPATNPETFYSGTSYPSGWNTSLTTYGGTCLIDTSFNLNNSSTISQKFYSGLQIDNIVQTPLQVFATRENTIGTNNKTVPSSFRTYYNGISAGAHTLAIVLNQQQYNNLDTTSRVNNKNVLNMKVVELSNSLTSITGGRTFPLINIVNIFTEKTANSVSGESGVQSWYSTFTTYGGICTFDVSLTMQSVDAAQKWIVLTTVDNSGNTVNWAEYDMTFNVPQDHRTMNFTHTITNLVAGTYQMRLNICANTYVDTTDVINMRMIEYARELTDGTPPTVTNATKNTNYQGCYTDNTNNTRVFRNVRHNQTVQSCNDLAKSVSSPYFGIQQWQESGAENPRDIGACWYDTDATLAGVTGQGVSTSCGVGTDLNSYGGNNTNAIYKTN